jgi:Oxygenase domain of the 2OGFeDO superfamily
MCSDGSQAEDAMKKDLPVRNLVPAMTEAEALDLISQNKLFSGADVDNIVTHNEIGLKPDGEPLYLLIRNVIPYEFCFSADPAAKRIATNPVVGGTRSAAAGAPMEPRTRKDGTKGKRYEVPFRPHLAGAKEGIAGYYSDRNPDGSGLRCRLTAFTANEWEQFQELLPLTRKVAEVFQEYLPERYAVEAAAASRIDPKYVIAGTPFTTVTANLNFQTAAHIDQGDLEGGFGALTMLSSGDFSGGELVFPRYRVAVRFQITDILLCDVHQVHGNLPVTGVEGEYARLSLVYYLREQMLKACPSAANSLE